MSASMQPIFHELTDYMRSIVSRNPDHFAVEQRREVAVYVDKIVSEARQLSVCAERLGLTERSDLWRAVAEELEVFACKWRAPEMPELKGHA